MPVVRARKGELKIEAAAGLIGTAGLCHGELETLKKNSLPLPLLKKKLGHGTAAAQAVAVGASKLALIKLKRLRGLAS